jgi:hypothetical protein
VSCPPSQQLQQPQQPSTLYRAVASPSPSTPSGLQVQLLGPFPTPTTARGRRSSSARKVLLLVQQHCELTAPLLAVVIVAGRLRRQYQLQPLRFSSTEVCLPHQLPDAATVIVPTSAAAALWCWGWFANEYHHPIRRQHHGRVAHLKESKPQCHNHGHLTRRKPHNTSRSNNKNKRDLT